MAIILKNFKTNTGIVTNKYVKIDSIRVGMGEGNYISCYCSEWYNQQTRSDNMDAMNNNIVYHIPDENISITNGSLIEAVYPAFKKFFEIQGYEVEDDLNSYSSNSNSQYPTEHQVNTAFYDDDSSQSTPSKETTQKGK